MHSLYARVNNGFAFMSSCLMAMLAAIALSSFLFTADPMGNLVISNFKVYASTLRYLVHPTTDNGMQCRCQSEFSLSGGWAGALQLDRRLVHPSINPRKLVAN